MVEEFIIIAVFIKELTIKLLIVVAEVIKSIFIPKLHQELTIIQFH